jgi:hypothetical protein
MYTDDAINSFNKYVSENILPQLPYNASLYTYKVDDPIYPAIFVTYPFVKDSNNSYLENVFCQIEIMTNNHDRRTVGRLTDSFRRLLNLSNSFKYIANYNFDNINSPVENGFLLISEAGKPRERNDLYDQGIEIRIFELYLSYKDRS